MVSATRLLIPCAVTPDHATVRGASLLQETLGPTTAAQPEGPSGERHLRIMREKPSSAGPGSDWLISVPPCRSANRAPPSVTCTVKPHAEESVVAEKSVDVFSFQTSGACGMAPPDEARRLLEEASVLDVACT